VPNSALTDARIKAAHTALGMALVGNAAMPLDPWWGDVHMREEAYFHSQPLASTSATLNFFTAANSEHVTNWPQPGYIPGNHGMWATSLMFTICGGYQPDGTAEADGEPYQTDTDPLLAAADMVQLINHARVIMQVGTRVVVDRKGLQHFPSGGGAEFQGVHTNTTTTTVNSFGLVKNGQANRNNRFLFTPPVAIYPNDQVKLSVRWPFSRTLKDTYTITAELVGGVVSK